MNFESSDTDKTEAASPTTVDSDIPLVIAPASNFTLEMLNDAYNQARADYLIAMPMTVAQLQKYIFTYDIALEHSVVAIEEQQPLGLAMLGVRLPRTWITRLGILQVKRRRGTGQRLMEALIERSWQLEAHTIILEVIKNNAPAHRLFCKLGFSPTRELLVLHRSPEASIPAAPIYAMRRLTEDGAVTALEHYQGTPSWLNEIPSLHHAGNLEGMEVHLQSGDWGWITYQRLPSQLGRLALQAETADKEAVYSALLHALHTAYPNHETHHENLSADDPCFPALQAFGYTVAFERIEMYLRQG
ncbi:MAG: GNAT family N-acetyltransferase [Anaerolineae bacterium]|nr:GNAT family N-acetyltransferase [Anaerolineae bacterium]